MRVETWTAVCDHFKCDEMGGCDTSEKELVLTLKEVGWWVGPNKEFCPRHKKCMEPYGSRTEAVKKVLRNASKPLRPREIQQALHESGRIDEYKLVTSTLSSLAQQGFVRTVSRGQWIWKPQDPS